MLKKCYIKWRINFAIVELKRKKLSVPRGKEEEMKEVVQAFEEYKEITIKQLQDVYEKYCIAVKQKEQQKHNNKK